MADARSFQVTDLLQGCLQCRDAHDLHCADDLLRQFLKFLLIVFWNQDFLHSSACLAASSFCASPPIPWTNPFIVNSPVNATSLGAGCLVIAEAIPTANASPALAPSFRDRHLTGQPRKWNPSANSADTFSLARIECTASDAAARLDFIIAFTLPRTRGSPLPG